MSGATETELHVEAPSAIAVPDALAQWRREAQHGVRDTGRYRAPYFVWGEGPPLVFIHGLCDRARSFVPVMAHLRRQFRCIGYELPDGRTDGARVGGYRHTHLVDELCGLLDHLSARRAYLFGSSFGSTIALAAMLEHRERFPRSVLQGGFARRVLVPWERIIFRFLRYGRGVMGTLPLRRRFHPGREHDIFNRHGHFDAWDFLMENSNDVSKAGVACRGRIIEQFDFRPRLPEVRQPVLLIRGEDDLIVPRCCEDDLMSGLPNAARVEIPECGHYPQYTHPALTAELMRQFLTEPACQGRECISQK